MISNTIWKNHSQRVEELVSSCPHVQIGGKTVKRPDRYVAHSERDEWGCLWAYPGNGLDGQVVEHPLVSWDKLPAWRPPSASDRLGAMCKDGEIPSVVKLQHGFLFLRLTYLRGFENAMVDIAEEDHRLYELRDLVSE